MNKFMIMIIFYSFFLTSCLDQMTSPSSIAIYKGEEVDEREYSAVVKTFKNNVFDCSAVAIAKDLFLTAAHCASNCGLLPINEDSMCKPHSSIEIKSLDESFEVSHIKLPERIKYRNNISLIGFDLALLRINGVHNGEYWDIASNQDSYSQILEKNRGRHISLANTLYGYGYGNSYGETKRVLRRGSMAFRGYYSFHDEDIHVGSFSSAKICLGDSGSPLAYELDGKKFVVGIASRHFHHEYNTMTKGCKPDDGGLYINLNSPKVRQWLEQAIIDIRK